MKLSVRFMILAFGILCLVAVMAPAHVLAGETTNDPVLESIDKAFTEAEKHEHAELGEATVLNGTHESLGVQVISWRDMPFQTVKRQTFDYSCGSAAVATLLTYVYGDKTSEAEVFKDMFESGDKDKIRQEGFSLLDMRNYLNRKGYAAKGFRIDFPAIEKHKIPFIALINQDGYMHFVVLKSLAGLLVLIGDPNKGNVIYTREEFSKMWNGISLVVTNHARAGHKLFGNDREWSFAHPVASPDMGEHPGLDSVNLPFPNWQLAPTNMDILSSVHAVTSSLTSH